VIGYGAGMFEGWSEYFFMIGSSAAALIGLMFIVVTLTAGRDRAEVERGRKLYTNPIVCHLAVVLLLSGAAIAPTISATMFGAAAAAIALAGLVGCIVIAVGINRICATGYADAFDIWWYGVVPALVYLGLGVASVAVLSGASWALDVIAATLMALLLVSIHNEWDLVTFLAPIAKPKDQEPR
jgi:membrane-associated HD superfamily phosphohydrolase